MRIGDISAALEVYDLSREPASIKHIQRSDTMRQFLLLLAVVSVLQASAHALNVRDMLSVRGTTTTFRIRGYPPKPSKSSSPKRKKSRSSLQSLKLKQRILNFVEGIAEPGPRFVHHVMYWFTSFDAVNNVRLNEYSERQEQQQQQSIQVMPVVYSKLFYFAQLRPRLLYSVGALLRALQMCTPLSRVIDPSVGVGAGINLCALIAGSRWVKPLVLGWATTKWAWTWLGAKNMQGAHLPITLSIRDAPKQQHHKQS